MKFGNLLRTTACDLPEVTCLFQTYKQLKKQLKRLPDRDQVSAAGAAAAEGNPEQQQALTNDEAHFVATIDESLNNLNNMFLEREEEAVIRLERLQAAAQTATDDDTRRAVYKQLVDFHGEVLLLVHWSVLAYTATVKILKKHHKRTGALLHAPQLENLLSQPFCSTEVMTQLAQQAEECAQELSSYLSSTAATSADRSNSPLSHAAGAQPPGVQADNAMDLDGQAPPQRAEPAVLVAAEEEQVAMQDAHGVQGASPAESGSGGAAAAAAVTAAAVQAQVTTAAAVAASQPPAAARGQHTRLATTSSDTSGLSEEGEVSDDSHILAGLHDLVSTHPAWGGSGPWLATKQHKQKRSTCTAADAEAHSPALGSRPAAGSRNDLQQLEQSAAAPEAGGSGGQAVALPAPSAELSGVSGAAPRSRHHHHHHLASLLHRTQVALDTWSQLKATASTPSTVLPTTAAAASSGFSGQMDQRVGAREAAASDTPTAGPAAAGSAQQGGLSSGAAGGEVYLPVGSKRALEGGEVQPTGHRDVGQD